jgi:hypothetical protein
VTREARSVIQSIKTISKKYDSPMKQLHQTNKPFGREKSQKAQKGNAFFLRLL